MGLRVPGATDLCRIEESAEPVPQDLRSFHRKEPRTYQAPELLPEPFALPRGDLTVALGRLEGPNWVASSGGPSMSPGWGQRASAVDIRPGCSSSGYCLMNSLMTSGSPFAEIPPPPPPIDTILLAGILAFEGARR